MKQEDKWIRDIQKRGSRKAANQLIHAYYDEIYVFVYQQTGVKEDAMDLTQDIFIAVLHSLASFDPRKASFRTWLYRIATNKVIDARRKRTIQTVPIDDMEPEDTSDFTSQIQDRTLLNQIESRISELDLLAQAVYRLRLYGDKSFPEIASILNEQEAAVKARYYRLMGRLRKEFGSNEGF